MWADHKVTTCQLPGCMKPAASGHLLCWTHWGCLPRKLRDACWDAWKRGAEVFGPADREAALKVWLRLKADVLHAIERVVATDLDSFFNGEKK